MRVRPFKLLLWIAGVVVVLVLAAITAVWMLVTPDRIRTSLEAQASARLGEPVRIGSLEVGWYPRLALQLERVTVGDPVRVQAEEAFVSAGVRALLERRVEEAEIGIRRSRVDVPALLDTLSKLSQPQTGAPPAGDSSGGFRIGRVRAITLDDVTLVAGGHEVRTSTHGTFEGTRLAIESLHAETAGTTLDASGDVRFETPLQAEFRIKARELDVNRLLQFTSAAFDTSGTSGQDAAATSTEAPPHVRLQLEAERGILADIAFRSLAATADVRGDRITLDPIGATVFGGRLKGTILYETAGGRPRARVTGGIDGADVASVLRWQGQTGDPLTGRISGTVRLASAGGLADAGAWRGTARARISNGVLRGLSRVRQAVVSFAGRTQAGDTRSDDRFESMSGDFALEGSSIRCENLVLLSRDVELRGQGTVGLPDGRLALTTRILLSPELSSQAGRDLYRLARDGDRIVLGARIGGVLGAPSVALDVQDAVGRALRNKVEDEAGSLFDRLLKGRAKRK